MKAAFITIHGGNETVSLGQRPKPVRQNGHVLVRLRAATLNRVDPYLLTFVKAAALGMNHLTA